MSKANALKNALSASRSKIRMSDAETTRTGSAYAAAVAIGITSKTRGGEPPTISKLSFAGVPGTIVLAALAKGGSTFATGKIADVLNGVGDAAAIIGLSKFVEGATIAGIDESPNQAIAGRRSRMSANEKARRLERQLASRLDQIDSESEISALER